MPMAFHRPPKILQSLWGSMSSKNTWADFFWMSPLLEIGDQNYVYLSKFCTVSYFENLKIYRTKDCVFIQCRRLEGVKSATCTKMGKNGIIERIRVHCKETQAGHQGQLAKAKSPAPHGGVKGWDNNGTIGYQTGMSELRYYLCAFFLHLYTSLHTC